VIPAVFNGCVCKPFAVQEEELITVPTPISLYSVVPVIVAGVPKNPVIVFTAPELVVPLYVVKYKSAEVMVAPAGMLDRSKLAHPRNAVA
jgi:hypothetical protein